MKEKIKTITCDCNDSSCLKKGEEGEVAGHIDDCSCDVCHRYYGKVSDILTADDFLDEEEMAEIMDLEDEDPFDTYHWLDEEFDEDYEGDVF